MISQEKPKYTKQISYKTTIVAHHNKFEYNFDLMNTVSRKRENNLLKGKHWKSRISKSTRDHATYIQDRTAYDLS